MIYWAYNVAAIAGIAFSAIPWLFGAFNLERALDTNSIGRFCGGIGLMVLGLLIGTWPLTACYVFHLGPPL